MLERIQPQPEPTSTRTAITPWEYGDIPKIVASFATDGYNPREREYTVGARLQRTMGLVCRCCIQIQENTEVDENRNLQNYNLQASLRIQFCYIYWCDNPFLFNMLK